MLRKDNYIRKNKGMIVFVPCMAHMGLYSSSYHFNERMGRLYWRCAYLALYCRRNIVINFNRLMESLAGKLAGKFLFERSGTVYTSLHNEVSSNANFPRERKGLKSRGVLLFDQTSQNTKQGNRLMKACFQAYSNPHWSHRNG